MKCIQLILLGERISDKDKSGTIRKQIRMVSAIALHIALTIAESGIISLLRSTIF